MERTITNPVIKDEVTFVKTYEETNGELTELDLKVMPNGGNLLHYHSKYSETFIPMEGELGLKTGRFTKKIIKPGESFTAKPGQLHAFFNPGQDPIKVKVIVEPAHQGFENGLRIGYGMAHDGLTNSKGMPKKFSEMALGIVMSDINLPAPFNLLSPIFKYVAKREREKGVEQQFIDRYCK